MNLKYHISRQKDSKISYETCQYRMYNLFNFQETKVDNIGKQGGALPLPTSKSLSAALAAKSAEGVRASTFATAPIEASLVAVMPSINGQTPGLEGYYYYYTTKCYIY